MMFRRAATSLATFAFTFVVLAVGCGDDNRVVDGSCAAGYVACDGRCIPGTSCEGDGSLLGDGAAEGGSGTDDGATTDGATRDGSSTDDGASGDACPPPPYVTAAACGSCFVQCAAPTDTCRLDGTGAYTCQLPCPPPEIACHGECIDVSSDPTNCGACGKVCASNLCVNGVCQGATPGDVVVIGHDYRAGSPGSAQARLLTNAVLIPSSNPLRILSYERYAEAQSVANVKQLVQSAAMGRVLQYTVANDATLLASPTLAQSYDVVLVYDQRDGDAATLQAEGASWKPHLATFAAAGGVVVALDGNAGLGNMPALLTSAGLLDVAAHTSLTPGSRVAVVAPADRVGTLVASPYGTFQRSVSFTSNEPNGGDVVYVTAVDLNPGVGEPVVVHKVVR